jgi:uracil-DNA glycosylase family 4
MIIVTNLHFTLCPQIQHVRRGSGASGLWIYGADLRVDDVKLGFPITGEAGQLLSRLFQEVGISEHETFITNVVRYRPANRNSYATEYKTCMENPCELGRSENSTKIDSSLRRYAA